MRGARSECCRRVTPIAPKSNRRAMSRCRTRTCIYREAWLALAVAARTRRATRRHVRCAREQPRREEKSGEAMAGVCALLLVAVLPPVVVLLVSVAGRAAARGVGALARAHYAWPAGSPSVHARKCGRRAAPEQPEHELRVSRHRGGAAVECAVCLSGVAEGDEVRELRCRHVFHRACLDRWLATPPATCPLCRSRLLTAPPVEAEEEEELDLDSDLLLLMAYVHGGGGWFWSP
ncbi:unnamed protein product [Triticum aestivum]|uniref:RING-type domain-containing protein n=2 Tax=Triticum aestivum TaxID=4565 RepID=A0A7H4LCC8_WHEAT|nr:probable E3 ubiquitin-protein ligase ATL45 [Triticum aestivum]SPT16266.1 unnamed protein product [Triticum aestivum]